jgi:hypothetical protein
MPQIAHRLMSIFTLFSGMNRHVSNRQALRPFRRFLFYLPFTWYFVIFAACCCGGYFWIQTFRKLPDTAYADIFPLLLQVAFWFLISFLSLSLLSVLISFFHFIITKRKGITEFQIKTKLSAENEASEKQEIHVYLQPVLKPLLGFVKLRLQYDESRISKKFSLIEGKKNKLISQTIDGTYHWQLPVIKEYRIENAIVYFEDFFQFFSLTLPLSANSRFYTGPAHSEIKKIKTFPRKTEDTNTRIEEIKRVEGEHLSYKNFEGNDDVRRIVWKIYARNKELVVRVPEVLDPYASHVYLYASFYSSFGMDLGEVVDVPFLNYYKTFIWSIYRQLVGQGFEVRYISDQATNTSESADPQQAVRYTLSISNWQADKDLAGYVNHKDAAMVVVSSLSDAEQVSRLAEQWGNEISFVFVKLTDSIGHQPLSDWLQWLFIKNEPDAVIEYRRKWNFARLRSRILENERKLASILKNFARSEVMEA